MPYLEPILGLLGIALMVYAIVVLSQARRTLSNMDRLMARLDAQLDPLINDIQQTVTAVNSDLGKVHEFVDAVSDIREKVTTVTRVVQNIVSSPLFKMTDISAGAKAAFKTIVKR